MSPARAFLNESYRTIRRVAVAVIGFTVLGIGIVLIVTPGPAFVVIPIGLGILAIEFAWARRWLEKIKEKAQQGADYMRGKGRTACDTANAGTGNEPAKVE
jgi:uncharacterized protein (TIGR02611 family)